MQIHRINDFNNIKVGNKYSTKFNGFFEIVDINKNIYTIRFIKTGYIKNTNISKIKQGNIKDLYRPVIYNIGFIGDPIPNSRLKRNLYTRWRNMISRCYNKHSKYYHIYGGNGVKVCNDWHNFSIFYHDAQKLDGWNLNDFMDKKITLDKDKLQQDMKDKIYSKDTCCWLTMKEQNQLINFVDAHSDEMCKFAAQFPDGHIEYCKGIKKFCRSHNDINFIPQCISSCLKGTQNEHKKVKFKYYLE